MAEFCEAGDFGLGSKGAFVVPVKRKTNKKYTIVQLNHRWWPGLELGACTVWVVLPADRG